VLEALADELERLSDPRLGFVTLTGVEVTTDLSFADFLEGRPGGRTQASNRRLAGGFVEGFHAADVTRISAQSIAPEPGESGAEMAAHIGRPTGGYDALMTWLARDLGSSLRLESPVRGIEWGGRKATVDVHGRSGRRRRFTARAIVVTVPIAWAVMVINRAERATVFKRSPILAGVAGAVVFATMAIPSEYVLFSGQPGYQHLVGLSNGTLAYLTVAKWIVLCVALTAGWRGGPIFPTLFSIGAFAVLVHDPLGVPPEILMVAGAAAVSVVFLQGKIPAAFVLALYVAPLSYAGVILVGAVGSATALAVAGSLHLLPTAAPAPPAPDETAAPAPAT